MSGDILRPDGPTFDGLIHVHNALSILVEGNQPLLERLEKAMYEFFAAGRLKEAWPPDELVKALEIDAKYEKAKVEGTLDRQARSIASDLLHLQYSLGIEDYISRNRQERLDKYEGN